MKRGQSALELILVTGAVIVLAYFFAMHYVSTQPTTTALIIAKNRLAQEFNTLDHAVLIQSITSQIQNNELTISIQTIPSGLDEQNAFNAITTELTGQIKDNTGFDCVAFQFNASNTPCA